MAVKNILERSKIGGKQTSSLRKNVYVGVHVLQEGTVVTQELLGIAGKSAFTALDEIKKLASKRPGATVIMPKAMIFRTLAELARKNGLKVVHLPENAQNVYEKRKNSIKFFNVGTPSEGSEIGKLIKKMNAEPEVGKAIKNEQEKKLKLAQATVENSILKTMLRQKEPHLLIAEAQHLHNLSNTPGTRKLFSGYRNATNSIVSPYLKKEDYGRFGQQIAAARRRILGK